MWAPPMTAFNNQTSASLLRNATWPVPPWPVRPWPCCRAGITGPSGPGFSSRLPLWPWGWARVPLLHTCPSMGFWTVGSSFHGTWLRAWPSPDVCWTGRADGLVVTAAVSQEPRAQSHVRGLKEGQGRAGPAGPSWPEHRSPHVPGVRGDWRILQQACPRGCGVCSLEAWTWPGPSPAWVPQVVRTKKGAWCGGPWPGARPGSFLKQVFATRPWQWG